MIALPPWEHADRTRIGRLLVQSRTDSTTLRLGLSGMLGRADLRPPGMPPAAVLIVRRMADPLPGRSMSQPMLHSIDRAWERAAREALAGFYRNAARPSREAVPASANAVVFADEGELLASLVLDLPGGQISEHWWWHTFSGSFVFGAPSPLASLLCDRAIWVPAALALLARQDHAVKVVRALAPREALAVIAAVSQAHGAAAVEQFAASLPETLSDSTPSANEVEDGAWDAGRVPKAQTATGEKTAISGTALVIRFDGSAASWRAAPAAPPWAAWLPDRSVPVELRREQRCLLGVALALHHRPEAVRNPAFAAALRSWWYTSDREPGRLPAPPRLGSRPGLPSRTAPETRNGAPLRRRAQPVAAAGAVPAESPLRTTNAAATPPLAAISELPSIASPFPAPRSPVTELLGDGRIGPDAPPARTTLPLSARTDGASGPTSSPSNDGTLSPTSKTAKTLSGNGPLPAVDGPLVSTPHDTVAPLDDGGLILEEGIETALGGVLFLINLMCALDLPQCFEQEWRLASTVGAWGVLEALGRALLADDDEVCDDWIWPALAALSGRGTGERLGAGLPRRAAYRLPMAWAAQLPADGNEPQAWAARGGRLRLWSRAGYLLSETRRDASPAAAQADHEAQRWGLGAAPPRARFGNAPLAALSRPLIVGIDHALKHWLSFLVPFLRQRLVSALGFDPTETSLKDVLLARPGRLYVTTTHVDLVMGLETASLPVRLAGLDRNPGWLAEFGRVIMFHFE